MVKSGNNFNPDNKGKKKNRGVYTVFFQYLWNGQGQGQSPALEKDPKAVVWAYTTPHAADKKPGKDCCRPPESQGQKHGEILLWILGTEKTGNDNQHEKNIAGGPQYCIVVSGGKETPDAGGDTNALGLRIC